MSHTYFQLSTVITVSLYQQAPSDTLFRGIDSLLHYYDSLYSPQGVASQEFLFNTSNQDTITVSPLLWEMLHRAITLTTLIDNRFNLTLLPIKEFWQPESGDSTTLLPSLGNTHDSLVVKRLISQCSMKNLTLLPHNQVVRKSNALIDLGGIAKGFVLRAIAQYLDSHAVSHYLINAGGDVVTHGTKANKPFIIGIQAPRGDSLIALLPLTNQSIVTSGDYERYRIDRQGNRIHHLFDAYTGFPATTNQSLTIIANDPITADILSTGLFALPADSILITIRQFPQVEALIIDKEGNRFSSQHFPSTTLRSKQ